MNIKKNIIVAGRHRRPVLLDLYGSPVAAPQPLVIFSHGFKGFKDWGHWHLLARHIAGAGCIFLKFNFSHNGTTPENPEAFDDLEAFGHNNYGIELDDLDSVIDWALSSPPELAALSLVVDPARVFLIGHSRGGGISLIQAARDPRVAKLVTWAGVSRLDFLWSQQPALLETWKTEGVIHVENARTHQQMPLYYQLYEDFELHHDRYDLRQALAHFDKPYLIVNGTADPAVPAVHARTLQTWCPGAQLLLIEGADHVFGGRHPFPDSVLPEHARQLAMSTEAFLFGTHPE